MLAACTALATTRHGGASASDYRLGYAPTLSSHFVVGYVGYGSPPFLPHSFITIFGNPADLYTSQPLRPVTHTLLSYPFHTLILTLLSDTNERSTARSGAGPSACTVEKVKEGVVKVKAEYGKGHV